MTRIYDSDIVLSNSLVYMYIGSWALALQYLLVLPLLFKSEPLHPLIPSSYLLQNSISPCSFSCIGLVLRPLHPPSPSRESIPWVPVQGVSNLSSTPQVATSIHYSTTTCQIALLLKRQHRPAIPYIYAKFQTIWRRRSDAVH